MSTQTGSISFEATGGFNSYAKQNYATLSQIKGQFATCGTGAATAAKVATIVPADSGWTLYEGATVTVKFTSKNTAATPTLNVNNTGAKEIRDYNGDELSKEAREWFEGSAMALTYDGTYWRIQDSNLMERVHSAETGIEQNANSIVSFASMEDNYTDPSGNIVVNKAKSYVDQTAEGITTTISDMNEKVETIANPNLSPWFSMLKSDVYDADDNPSGYWHRITENAAFTTYDMTCEHNGSGGWAHFAGSITSDNHPFVRFEPVFANLKADTDYTFLLEIDQLVVDSMIKGIVWRFANGTGQTDTKDPFTGEIGIGSTTAVSPNGEYRVKAKTRADISAATALGRAYVQIYGTGTFEFWARLSLYESGHDEEGAVVAYSGPYKPYVVDNSRVTTISNTVNSVKSTADVNSAHLSNLTQTLGTNADGTTKTNDIVHKYNNLDQTLDGTLSTVGAMIDESTVGPNILTGNMLNPFNWTISAPTGANYTKTAYGTAGAKVEFTGVSGYEWLYSPVITVKNGHKYTLSVEYTVGVDYVIASGRGGFGLSVYSSAPPFSAYDSVNSAFLGRAQFFEAKTSKAMKATITFTATSTTVYLGLNGGQIADGSTRLSFTIDSLKLVENVESRMSSAETQISQNVNAISLRATKQQVLGNMSLYTPLEYLQSSGTQYINTGVIPTAYPIRVSVEVAYMSVPTSEKDFAGNLNTNVAAASAFVMGVNGSAGKWYQWGGKSGWNPAGSPAANVKYAVDMEFPDNNRRRFVIDGIEYSNYVNDYNSFTLGSNAIGLFSGGANRAYDAASVRIYSARIYNGGNLVRNLIPVKRISDSALGMYDQENDVFYANVGTGSFTAGAESNWSKKIASASAELSVQAGVISSKVANGNVISSINQSPETVKISASKVEIDGTAVFNSIKAKADAKYDAKGAAADAEANAKSYADDAVDNLEIGGRNLQRRSNYGVYSSADDYNNASAATFSADRVTVPFGKEVYHKNYTRNMLSDVIPSGTELTCSVYVYSQTITDGNHRIYVSPLNGSAAPTWTNIKTIPNGYTGLLAWSYVTTTDVYGFVLDFDTRNATSGEMVLGRVKVEKGSKATDWTPAPEDTISKTQRIYYRKTASGAPAAPTSWVTVGNDNSNKYTQWTTKLPPIAASQEANATKYLYLYTCVQTVSGTGVLTNSEVLLDDTTTVIDGGKIITGSIAANRIDADSGTFNTANIPNLNASKINAGDIAAARIKTNVVSAINTTVDKINARNIDVSNINIGDLAGEIGGTNLLQKSSTLIAGSDSNGNSNATTDGGYGGAVKQIETTGAWTGPHLKIGQALTRAGVKIGDTVTLSIWLTTDSTTEVTTPALYLYRVSSTGNTVGINGLSTNNTTVKLIKGKWVRLWCTFDVTEYSLTATTARFEFSQATSYKQIWSAPQLEKGNKVTDWQPAPEDVDDAIDDASKIASNYISASSSGIRIASASPSTQKQRIWLTSSRIDFYNAEDVSIGAISGDTARFGPASAGHVNIDGNSGITLYDNTNKKRVTIDTTDGISFWNQSGTKVGSFAGNDTTFGLTTATHLFIDSDGGINFYDKNSKRRTLINHDGLHIYNTDGSTEVATFASTATIGTTTTGRITVTATGVGLYNKNNKMKVSIGTGNSIFYGGEGTYPYIELGTTATSAINIRQSATSYTSITSSGLDIYTTVNSAATKIASFGTTATIGATNNAHFIMAANKLQAFSSTNTTNPYFEVSASAMKYGSYTVANTSDVANAGNTASLFITPINDNEIKLHSKTGKASNNYAKMNSDGLWVYKQNNLVAKFSDSITLGKEARTRVEVDFNSFRMLDRNGNKYCHISDLRDENGSVYLEEEFVVPDSGKVWPTFEYSHSASNDVIVYYNQTSYAYDSGIIGYVDGTEKRRMIKLSTNVIPVGSTITIKYRATDDRLKGYTFGIRNETDNDKIGGLSFSEGYHTSAIGYYSHSEGEGTTASGPSSHAQGSSTVASGANSHAEGWRSVASGEGSHAEGGSHTSEWSIASGAFSHAEGISKAAGRWSHAENGSTANGDWSHAEGTGTANGSWSHAEGNGKATGSYSHAEGSGTASGYYSHASGAGTIAGYDDQFVCGKYNSNQSTSLFEIGNGTNSKSANALTVDKSGNLTASGTITANKDLAFGNGTTATLIAKTPSRTAGVLWVGGSKKAAGDANGTVVRLQGGGLMLVGGGEYPTNRYNLANLNDGDETLFLGSDGAVYVETNGQTIANRKTFTFGADGTFNSPSTIKQNGTAVSLSGTSLFENASGRFSGKIDFSETAANFTFIEIYCKDNDGRYCYTKVWSPNGKTVNVTQTLSYGGNFYIKSKAYTISGAGMDTANTSGIYHTGEVNAAGSNSGSSSDILGVVKVIGYK